VNADGVPSAFHSIERIDMPEGDAQKKEIDEAEELQDLTPQKDATGGGPHVKVFDGRTQNASVSPDAQKKEIE
jgi:hypothetical protein